MSGVSKGSIGNFETGLRGLSRKAQYKIRQALDIHSQSDADSCIHEAPVTHTVSADARIAILEAELVDARSVIRDQASALAALAAKPTVCASAPRAYGAACGASAGSPRKEKKGA